MCYHDLHTPYNQLDNFNVLYSNIGIDLQQILILIQVNPLYIATKIVTGEWLIYHVFYHHITSEEAEVVIKFAIKFVIPSVLRDTIDFSTWSERSITFDYVDTYNPWCFYGTNAAPYDTKRLGVDKNIETLEEFFICRNMDPYVVIQLMMTIIYGTIDRVVFSGDYIEIFYGLFSLHKKTIKMDRISSSSEQKFRDIFVNRLKRLINKFTNMIENIENDSIENIPHNLRIARIIIEINQISQNA